MVVTGDEQLNQRLKNMVLRKRVSVESQYRPVWYLTEDDATNNDTPLRIYKPFGRVRKLWHLDMGLGYVREGFMLVDEVDYETQQQQEWLMQEDENISISNSSSSVVIKPTTMNMIKCQLK